MPLVATVLLLLGIGPVSPSVAAQRSEHAERRLSIAQFLIAAGLLVFALKRAVIPATIANLNMDAAMSVMRERGDAATARKLLAQAVEADPLDPQPHVYLAQLDFDASGVARINGGELANAAISELAEAIRLDPENPKTYWLMAQWKLESLRYRGDTAMMLDAAQTAEAAATRDPQNAEVLATLARAYAGAGLLDDARSTAARSLELDALNFKLGHYDKLLQDAERDELQAMVSRELQ
jgi:predicted Zn-dependent protease